MIDSTGGFSSVVRHAAYAPLMRAAYETLTLGAVDQDGGISEAETRRGVFE